MKKRLMAAGLVVLMAATAFTGCSKVKKIDDSTEATTAEAETMARVDVDVDIPDFWHIRSLPGVIWNALIDPGKLDAKAIIPGPF